MDTEEARGLLAAGWEAVVEGAFRTGDYRDAESLLASARDRATAAGDRATEAAAIDRQGWLMHFQALDRGRDDSLADEEEALFRRALEIRREIDDRGGVAASQFGIGLVHQVLRQEWATAIGYFREAMELADEHGDLLSRSEAHRHVGFYYLVEQVDHERALAHLRTSLELRREHGDPRWIVGGLVALGRAETLAGQPDAAADHLEAAIREATDAGLKQSTIDQAKEFLAAV